MFKSTADVEGGRALYEGYSAVSDTGAHNFLRLRETVLLRKEARKMFVQANTRIGGNKLEFGDRHMNQIGGKLNDYRRLKMDYYNQC